MGILVYSLFWAMQDLYHQPWLGNTCAAVEDFFLKGFRVSCRRLNNWKRVLGDVILQVINKDPPI